MARTFNRAPFSVDEPDIENKFFNHANWKGLCTDKNYFNIDQETFEDCKNVYVDSEGVLKSRPAIKLLNVYGLQNIVNFWEFATIKVYETVENNVHFLNFVQDDEIFTVECSDKIKLTLFNNYIYVFQSNALNRYNINNKKYEEAEKFVYVPVTKTITMGVSSDLEPKNIFTSSEITRYIINSSDEVSIINAIGKNVTININDKSYDVIFKTAYKDLLFTKKLTLPSNSRMSDYLVGYNERVAISFSALKTMIFTTFVKVSDGKYKYYIHYSSNHLTFTTIDCPDGVLGEPKISKDGSLAAVLLSDGIYVISLLSTEFDGTNTYKKYPVWTNLLKTLGITFTDNINKYVDGYRERQNIVVGLDIIDDSHFAFAYGTNPIGRSDVGDAVFHLGGEYVIGHTLYKSLAIVIYDSNIPKQFPAQSAYNYYVHDAAVSEVARAITGEDGMLPRNVGIEYFTSSDINVQYTEYLVGSVESAANMIATKNLTLVLRSLFNDEYDEHTDHTKANNNLGYFNNLIKCPYSLASLEDVSKLRFYISSMWAMSSADVKQVGESTIYAETVETLTEYGYENRVHKYVLDNSLTTNIVTIYSNRLPAEGDKYYYPNYKYSKMYEAFIPYEEELTTEEVKDEEGNVTVIITTPGYLPITSGNNTLTAIRDGEKICPAGMYIGLADYIKIINVNRSDGYQRFVSESTGNFELSVGFNGTILTNSVYISEDFVETPLLFSLALPINNYVLAGIAEQRSVNNINYDLYTNIFYDDVVTIDVKSNPTYGYIVPEQISSTNSIYMSVNNTLYVSYNRLVNDVEMLYVPGRSKQTFNSDICYLHPIDEVKMGIFTEDGLYYTNVVDLENDVLGIAYSYYKSKTDVKCKKGMEVTTSFDGTYIIFSCDKGLVAMTYQNFVASTEQTIKTLSDVIYEPYKNFNLNPIKLTQFDYWIICYSNKENHCFVYDVRNSSFWYEEYNKNIEALKVIDNRLQLLSNGSIHYLDTSNEDYTDDGEYIDWYLTSQKLHLGTLNYYKNVISLIINNVQTEVIDKAISFDLSIRNYRTTISDRYEEPVTLEYDVELIRSYVKRCNSRKVNAFQYTLSSDNETVTPMPLSVNSIIVKYNIGGQIR